MGFYLPSGVVNTDSAIFVADTTYKFGPLIKQLSDQTLVLISYAQLSPLYTPTGYNFTVDVSSNPQLVVSYPYIDIVGGWLTFLLSGGIEGQQYNITIATISSGVQRSDVLTVSIPSSGDCDCVAVNPVPDIYTQLPLGSYGYINSAVRYFWGNTPPSNPGVLDQWYNSSTKILYEWTTDGATSSWIIIASGTLILEAPVNGIIHGRYNGSWVPEPVQTDAPKDGQPYARFMGNWQAIPAIMSDAPSDNNYYARRNAAWVVDPASSLPSTTLPLMDGAAAIGVSTFFARGDHIHPSDTTKYDASNPVGYQTAAQVTAMLVPYALNSSLPVGSNAVPLINGIAIAGTATAFARGDHVHPTDTTRLALAGGTMTGMLTLTSNPAGNLDAVPKQYVDNATANAFIDCGTY